MVVPSPNPSCPGFREKEMMLVVVGIISRQRTTVNVDTFFEIDEVPIVAKTISRQELPSGFKWH